MNLVEQIKKDAKKFFKKSSGSHDWEHSLRVLSLCLRIGKKEGADLKILQIAALLHDIGRPWQDESGGKISHAQKGAGLARKLLAKYHLEQEKIEQIVHCIATHRFRGRKAPLSKEAKILFDADKLDSIGAVGIGRAFLFGGEIGAKLHNKGVAIEKTKPYTEEDTAYREFMVKLKKVKDRMLTTEGRKIAQERHRFMIEFFERLDREVEGIL